MTSVVGLTAERANQIEAETIVDAEIKGLNLVLEKHNGGLIVAGTVIPPPLFAHPVGSIYMSTRPENPSTYLGGGTWVRWGKGRAPVGVDASQTEFNSVEKTGGEKAHTLSVNELPEHRHTSNEGTGVQSQSHTHTGVTNSKGAHTHNAHQPIAGPINTPGGGGPVVVLALPKATSSSGSHSHPFTTNVGDEVHTHAIASEGNGQAYPVLQPYQTCYMWKRTA